MKYKILLLAGNTLRAKAYVQQLQHLNSDLFDIEGLLYGFPEKECIIPELNSETKIFVDQQGLFIPRYDEPIEVTFSKNNWTYSKVDTVDVNSSEILDVIEKMSCDIVVFAGYGGQLLKQEHFMSGKKYLHMHPGKLPIERGSTTIYYSILNERNITVTAFFMTQSIDAGEDIVYSEYTVPCKGVNIDSWYDNIIRADCLVKALAIINSNKTVFQKQSLESEEYFIIHPVLKHIALLSLKDS